MASSSAPDVQFRINDGPFLSRAPSILIEAKSIIQEDIWKDIWKLPELEALIPGSNIARSIATMIRQQTRFHPDYMNMFILPYLLNHLLDDMTICLLAEELYGNEHSPAKT